MSRKVTVSVNGSSFEITFDTINFSTSQESVTKDDGTSTLTTYLNSHCTYKVNGQGISVCTTELQKLTEVGLDSEGRKVSIVETPLKFKSQDEVIDAVLETIKKNLVYEQVSAQEKSAIDYAMGEVSKFVL